MSDLNCGEIKIKLTNKKYKENAIKLIDGKIEHIFVKFIDSMHIEKNKTLIITTVSKYNFPSESFINFIETFFKNSKTFGVASTFNNDYTKITTQDNKIIIKEFFDEEAYFVKTIDKFYKIILKREQFYDKFFILKVNGKYKIVPDYQFLNILKQENLLIEFEYMNQNFISFDLNRLQTLIDLKYEIKILNYFLINIKLLEEKYIDVESCMEANGICNDFVRIRK